MAGEVKRRSPRSPAGEQRPKIPVTLGREIEIKLRSDAERLGVTLSFLMGQIIERHYGKRILDPDLEALSRRVSVLESIVLSGNRITVPAVELFDISEEDRIHLLQKKAESDISNQEMADAAGISSDNVKLILTGDISQVDLETWKKLIASV